LSDKQRRNHEAGFLLVGGYRLKDGRRLGEVRLTALNTAADDDLNDLL
jgi:hypothetical protein